MSCTELRMPQLNTPAVDNYHTDLPGGVTISFSETTVDARLRRLKRTHQYSHQRLSICLTLFNEPAHMVAESLEAIRRNAEYFSGNGPVREIVVAIIVDGVENLAPCTREYLQREGYLIGPDTTGEPYLLQWTRETIRGPEADRAVAVERLLLLKCQNSGKLHSHWCYYHLIQWLLPAPFCTQMDAGTAPATDALAKLWADFSGQPDLGALAANSLLPAPRRWYDPLAVFQYSSFLDERYSLWPREQLTGYLTVLPGQLHMVRWRAVAGTAARDLDQGSFTQRIRLAERCPVLSAYLAGLAPTNAADATAFLAEDRILGLALDRAEGGRWRLGYQPAARASTDGCQTWQELLRQRRRWLCGGTACLTKFLSASGAPAARGHGLWLLLLLALSPGMALTTLYALGAAARAGTNTKVSALTAAATLGAALTLAFWTLVAAGRSRGKLLQRAAIASAGIGALCWTINAFAYVTQAPSSPQKWLTLSGGCLALALSCATIFLYSRRDGLGRLRALPCYVVFRHAIRLLLASYALVNSHDLSWGTKGLGQGSGQHGRSARQLRLCTLLLVVALNAALAAAVLLLPAALLAWWLPLVAAALVLERGFAASAHFFLYRRAPRQRHLTPVATPRLDTSYSL